MSDANKPINAMTEDPFPIAYGEDEPEFDEETDKLEYIIAGSFHAAIWLYEKTSELEERIRRLEDGAERN